MIDIKFIRDNLEKVKKGIASKQLDPKVVGKVLDLDEKCKNCLIEYQNKQVEWKDEQKKTQKLLVEKGIDNQEVKDQTKVTKKLKEQNEALWKKIQDLFRKRKEAAYEIPNLPKPDVRVGRDERENEVIKKHKEPIKFSFKPRDHLDLGELLDIIDVKMAAKVSGTRFGYLKNEGALLEFALAQLAFEMLIKEGFIPVVPPALIKQDVMRGLGYMEHGGDEDMFLVPKDNLILVGTAEHTLIPMHMDELLNKKELPKRYVGFSSAFRREAGSYGKDTRGILRVHQFDKVEMVSFVTEENGDKEHEYLLSLEEKLFQLLEIPYQVVKMCAGDLGFPVARKYDIEAWMPGQNKYREVTSTSTTTDFQARRLNIKYQDATEKKYVYILNGTAFAIGRTIIAMLENYQEEDGSVTIPKALRKYLNNLEKISPKKR